MGAAVANYNEGHEQVHQGVLSAFGIDHLLTVKN